MGDAASVAALSAVAFPETPEAWNLETVLSDRREPFPLPALERAVEEATAARDRHFHEFTAFRIENVEELKAILAAAARSGTKFTGRRAELYLAFEKHREERRLLEETLREARQEAESELALVRRSLLSEADSSKREGEVWIRERLVEVAVQGQEKPYRFTLKKYLLSAGGEEARSRWVITDIRAGH